MSFHFQKIESPIGHLFLVADETHLVAVMFDNGWKWYLDGLQETPIERSSKITKQTAKQLTEYFTGKRTAFDVPFRFEGTDFQQKVWTALTRIPYGKTWSYGDQAKSIGKPKAVRAVGATNGRNKINIIVPCHRVVGSSGKLTGYGGGIGKKEFLLRLEGVLL